MLAGEREPVPTMTICIICALLSFTMFVMPEELSKENEKHDEISNFLIKCQESGIDKAFRIPNP